MAEKRSVYLSSQALAMPRRCDSLSGRINQALERYAWILARDGPRIRAMFDAGQWQTVINSAHRWQGAPAAELPAAVSSALAGAFILGPALSDADLVLLADLAEGEL